MTDTSASGIQIADLDPAIRPQDDLFRHVNGAWLDATDIPSDKSRYGSFVILQEAAERAARAIIEDAAHAEEGTEERAFGDLYTSFMNEDRAELLGAVPITGQLLQVSFVSSVEAFLRTLGALERQGVWGLLQLFVDNDPGNPERYLVFAEQGGLGLPDESYYREERFAEIRVAYQQHLARMFQLAHLDDPAQRAARVYNLETQIAATHWNNVDTRDSEKTYNLYTWADAVAEASLDLDAWRDAMGVPPDAVANIVLREPSFIESLGVLVTEEHLPAWRDWLAWQVIRSHAAYLSSDFVTAHFEFYGRTLSGTPQLRARWKRAVSFVERAMGEAVGRSYVERHFPPEAKTAMDTLVAYLVAAYRASISQLDWMGEDTRSRALEKLSKFTPKIGYPVVWRDYSGLQVSADDLVGNVRAAAEFEFQRELGKIGKPIDRDEWFMTPQTINAYYNPGFNEIVFPAAILQAPFFAADRDDAANYGAIGAVIGHEIGHGFDDQGSKFDGDGRLIDWWSQADRAAFDERTAALIDQYSELAPKQVPDQHVNGALTIGENIGDLGGLSIAWRAYLLSLEGAEPPIIDGLTGAQRFFISWAQSWREKGRDEEVVNRLATDPHSPTEFRCNQVVRNIDEFYAAFGVTDSDELYLAPGARVSIW